MARNNTGFGKASTRGPLTCKRQESCCSIWKAGLNTSARYERRLEATAKGTVGVIESSLGERLRSRAPIERPHTKHTTRGEAPGKYRHITDGPLSQRTPEASEIQFQAPDTEITASLSHSRLMVPVSGHARKHRLLL